jgi:hypothetical protein
MSVKLNEKGDDLYIDNDIPHGYLRRELTIHRFGDGRAELLLTEWGEKRSKLCSMELTPEQISALVKFLSKEDG